MIRNNSTLGYLFLRVAMGVNLFGHGLVRVPQLQTFSEGLAKSFGKSILPHSFVYAFGLVVPIIELILGLMLIIGFKTKWAAILGASWIIILLFGSSTIENWEAMGSQMIYILFFYVLIVKYPDNFQSIKN